MYFLHETAIYYRHPYRYSTPNYSRCADALFARYAYTCCVYYRI